MKALWQRSQIATSFPPRTRMTSASGAAQPSQAWQMAVQIHLATTQGSGPENEGSPCPVRLESSSAKGSIEVGIDKASVEVGLPLEGRGAGGAGDGSGVRDRLLFFAAWRAGRGSDRERPGAAAPFADARSSARRRLRRSRYVQLGGVAGAEPLQRWEAETAGLWRAPSREETSSRTCFLLMLMALASGLSGNETFVQMQPSSRSLIICWKRIIRFN